MGLNWKNPFKNKKNQKLNLIGSMDPITALVVKKSTEKINADQAKKNKASETKKTVAAATPELSESDKVAEEERKKRLLRRTAFIQDSNKLSAQTGSTKLGV